MQQSSVEGGDDCAGSVPAPPLGGPDVQLAGRGADRQTPSETPYDKDGYGETKNAQITIVHALHLGVTVGSLLTQGKAAAKAAGYDESGYRVDETGLRINCKLGYGVPQDGRIRVILTAPEG